MHRTAARILAATAVGFTTLGASAEIITYRTTLTLTPSSITVTGFEVDGVFIPNDPDFASDPGRWLAPSDAFELTMTVDTSTPLIGYDYDFGRGHVVDRFIVGSSFRPLPTNTGLLSLAFERGPSLLPGASVGSNGLGTIFGGVWIPNQVVYIGALWLAIGTSVNLAGEGQPIGSIMTPLDGAPVWVYAELGEYPWFYGPGSVQFQASPLVRVIPTPGAAAVLGLAGLLASRRRR